MKSFYRPDDYLGASTNPDPMRIISPDECGPFYIQNGKERYTNTYILACVELLTYKVHLIPLPKLDTIHFVRVLEILQSMRGRMSTIILDDASSHLPLDQSTDPSPCAKN